MTPINKNLTKLPFLVDAKKFGVRNYAQRRALH